MSKKDLKAKFLELFKSSFGAISNTCLALHIDRGTYYIWLEKDKEFAAAIETLKGSFVDFVESKVHEKIKAGNDYWLKEWLRVHSKEWKPDDPAEFAGSINLTLNRKVMDAQAAAPTVDAPKPAITDTEGSKT